MMENFNLFDKMHEGMVVVSAENSLNLRFASKPAISLLKQKPESEVRSTFVVDGGLSPDSREDRIGASDLKKKLFEPVSMTISGAENLQSEQRHSLSNLESTLAEHKERLVSLESIIADLKAEGEGLEEAADHLNGRVFKSRRRSVRQKGDQEQSHKFTFTQIRTRKINYLEKPAIAIYLQNITEHINHLRLESQILEQKNKNATLESYTSTISHEFRTPLATCLMFLEGLVSQTKSQANLAILQLIISQLNLLLCLVNDVLDLKLI